MNDRYENEQDNPEENERESENIRISPEVPSTRRMTQIQIICCAVLLAAAVLLRLYGGDLYTTVKGWYLTQVNDSILPDEQVENVKQTVVSLWANISQPRTGPAISSSSQEAGSAVSRPAASSGQAASKNSQNTGGSQPVSPQASP